MKAALSSAAVVWTINFLDLCWGHLASTDTNEEPQELQEIKCYKVEAPTEPQINTNVEDFLLVFLFVFINCFVSRDHWQTTFITLNSFFLLSKTPTPCC